MTDKVSARLASAASHLWDYECHVAISIFESVLEESPESVEAHSGLFESYSELLALREVNEAENRQKAFQHFLSARRLSEDAFLFPKEYEPLQLIGVGGISYVFGVTYRGSRMALKILKPRFRTTINTKERFYREVKKLQDLGPHDNIVTLHFPGMAELDRMDDDLQPFYLMEVLSGPGLDDLIKERGTITPDRLKKLQLSDVSNILIPICSAISFVHSKGTRSEPLLHLDLKPSNVMRDDSPPAPTWKVIDFGTALLHQQREAFATKLLFFSPQYWAPELLRGKKPTTEADVYSLGKVVLELWFGPRALGGAEFLRNYGDLDTEMWFIVDTATQDNPEFRYQTASELTHALIRYKDLRQANERTKDDRSRLTEAVFWLLDRLFFGAILPSSPWVAPLGSASDFDEAIKRRQEATLRRSGVLVGLLIALLVRLTNLHLLAKRVYRDGFNLDLSTMQFFDPGFIGPFAVGVSIVILAYLYLERIVSTATSTMESGFGKTYLICLDAMYVWPVLVALKWPQYWLCWCGCGLLMVAIGNWQLYKHMSRYSHYTPDRNPVERKQTASDLLGWFFGSLIYASASFFMGWVNYEIAHSSISSSIGITVNLSLAGICTLINVYTWSTRTLGVQGRSIQRVLSWENELRSFQIRKSHQ